MMLLRISFACQPTSSSEAARGPDRPTDRPSSRMIIIIPPPPTPPPTPPLYSRSPPRPLFQTATASSSPFFGVLGGMTRVESQD